MRTSCEEKVDIGTDPAVLFAYLKKCIARVALFGSAMEMFADDTVNEGKDLGEISYQLYLQHIDCMFSVTSADQRVYYNNPVL